MDTVRLGARLRAARKAAGFKTSKAFLKKYKVPASTYSQHESGARTPDDKALQFYSKLFDVNFGWLKSGKGQPFHKATLIKSNVLKEELIDLTTLKKTIKKTSIEINQKLLTKILYEIINYHHSIISDRSLSIMIKDAVKIYTDIINKDDNHKIQSQALKVRLKSYKNKKH